MSAVGTLDLILHPDALLAMAEHTAALQAHAAALTRFAAAIEAQGAPAAKREPEPIRAIGTPAAPPAAGPVAPRPAPGGPPWATPDRVALLHEIVPSRRTWDEIVGALAALPGPTIPAPVTVRSYTKKVLHLHRRVTPDGEKIRVPHALTPERIRTPARDELLRREWPAGTDGAVILQQFNALPGRQIARGRLAILAAGLGLRRPGREVPRTPLPAPEPPPVAVPPPAPPSALGHALVAATAAQAPQPVARPVAAPPKPAPQPISRAEAIARIGAIRAPAPRVPIGEPVEADFDQIATWVAQRGLQFLDWDDLPGVNRKREQLLQPTFKRKFPSLQQRGTRS